MSPGSSVKVSVCVITYNQERFIRDCLQSIVRQDFAPLHEIIIGDDCSTDGTRDIIRDFQASHPSLVKTILQPKNTGGTKNYVDVHAAATGDFIAHLDGDDYWLPGKLRAQLDFMLEHPDCQLSGHALQWLHDTSLRPSPFGPFPRLLPPEAFFRYGNYLPHSSIMYRSANRAPTDDEDAVIDFRFNIRRARGGKIGYIDKALGVYRVSPASLCVSLAATTRSFQQNVKAYQELFKMTGNRPLYERAIFRIGREFLKDAIASGNSELAGQTYRIACDLAPTARSRLWYGLLFRIRLPLGLLVKIKRRLLPWLC